MEIHGRNVGKTLNTVIALHSYRNMFQPTKAEDGLFA